MADEENNQEPFEVQYEGEEEKRPALIRDGKATVTYPNGDTFVGTFVKNAKHGRGQYTFTTAKASFVGDYVNGVRSGHGVMTYPDTSVYDGAWSEGQRHGRGSYTYANGDRYIGGWKNDKRDGDGAYVYANDATTFKGKFVNGECRNGTYSYYQGAVHTAIITDGQVQRYVVSSQ